MEIQEILNEFYTAKGDRIIIHILSSQTSVIVKG